VNWQMAQEIQTTFITLVHRVSIFSFCHPIIKAAFTTKSEKENENPYKNTSWMKYFVMLTNCFFQQHLRMSRHEMGSQYTCCNGFREE